MKWISFFKRVVKHKYAGMILLCIAQSGCVYKREIELDLRISGQAVDESIEFLLRAKLIKPTKSEDKRRRESYSPTVAGTKSVHAMIECFKVVYESLPQEIRDRYEQTSELKE